MTVYDSKFSGGDLNASLTYQLALIYRAMITKEEDEEDVDHISLCTSPGSAAKSNQ